MGGVNGGGTVGGRADGLPVAIVGGGPTGLVAAAHVLERGGTPLVLEAGAAVGASIRAWSHVRLFSPWKYLTDPVAERFLEAAGWTAPDPEALPTGGELVERFLEPLAAHPRIAPHVRLGRRVVAVGRRGYDKAKTEGRDEAPFELVVRTPAGVEERVLARAVIDASGTYGAPNPMGSGGVPVAGEEEHAERIRYGIPDVLGRERARYAGRRVLVVGSGHSAFNALLELAELRESAPGTEIVWAVRRASADHLFGGEESDGLPARGALGARLRRLVEAGVVRVETGFRAERVAAAEGGIRVEGGASAVGPVDEVVVTTGFRPELGPLRELRLALDPALECPTALAPLIDPNVHSCGTVYPHGAEELGHPERDFYIVGMKSYGRAPTFLLRTGYEQVRSVVAALAGDREAARAVEWELPETGVCSTDGATPTGATGDCCCTTDEIVPIPLKAGPARTGSEPAAAGGCCR